MRMLNMVRKMKLNLKNFKIAMAREKINISDLAQRTGLARVTLDAYCIGRINPSTKAVGLIAEALNVDVTEIIDMEEK